MRPAQEEGRETVPDDSAPWSADVIRSIFEVGTYDPGESPGADLDPVILLYPHDTFRSLFLS